MLKFVENAQYKHNSSGRKWLIESADLRKANIRSPQGFSFEISEIPDVGNYFWTTNEFAAFLFYKRYQIASPEVEAYFKERLQREKYLYELSYATESDFTIASPIGATHYPYQVAGIEYGLQVQNLLLADSMRIGKSNQAIGIINNSEDEGKILILCPKTAKLVWVEQLATWLIDKKKIQILTSKSTIDYSADIYIANYDVLSILSGLTRIKFGWIIADEVHTCKNPDAKRSKFFFALQGTHKIGVSGTPLLNNPKDLLTVVQWLDNFWLDFYLYKGAFVTKSGITLTLEEVKDVLRSTILVRRIQPQVFTSSPIERRIVPLEIPEELKQYVELERLGHKNLYGLKDYTTARRLTGLGRVQDGINHILTYTSEPSDKLICFAWHKEVIDRVAASLGNRCVKIYGDTNEKDRQANIKRFQNDPNCSVIIGSIPAMSMAIDLSVGNHIVFLEQYWTPGLMEQAEERCSNSKQTKNILVEFLCYENSLDYHMCNIRMGKDVVSDRALEIIY